MSGIYDIDNIPPYQNKEYDIEELPISVDSDLTWKEKFDIIFDLEGFERQRYWHYIHKLATCEGARKTLKRLAKNPTFTQSRNQFIYDNLDGTPDRFIKGIINKYYETLRGCEGLTYTDLIQEGWIGLIEAAKRYDKRKGVKFSTYAYYWVQKYILKTLDKEIKTSQAETGYRRKVFEKSVEKRAFIMHRKEQLNEREQEILELYAEGHSIREIAKQDDVEIEKSRIHEILQGIKNQTGQNAPNSV